MLGLETEIPVQNLVNPDSGFTRKMRIVSSAGSVAFQMPVSGGCLDGSKNPVEGICCPPFC